jgi:hypothetical protein
MSALPENLVKTPVRAFGSGFGPTWVPTNWMRVFSGDKVTEPADVIVAGFAGPVEAPAS